MKYGPGKESSVTRDDGTCSYEGKYCSDVGKIPKLTCFHHLFIAKVTTMHSYNHLLFHCFLSLQPYFIYLYCTIFFLLEDTCITIKYTVTVVLEHLVLVTVLYSSLGGGVWCNTLT